MGVVLGVKVFQWNLILVQPAEMLRNVWFDLGWEICTLDYELCIYVFSGSYAPYDQLGSNKRVAPFG